MKSRPVSTSCFLCLLLLVELPVLATCRPMPMKPHKDGLTQLFQRMRRLISLAQGVAVHQLDTSFLFENSLTSLPTLKFRPTDLATVEASSTLSQLSSGLHSFKQHFDWLIYWHNHSGLVSPKIKEIAEEIQTISILAQIQIDTNSPIQSTVLSLPPLTSAWDINQASAVIHKRLLTFCNWYMRALLVLMLRTSEEQRGQGQGRQRS